MKESDQVAACKVTVGYLFQKVIVFDFGSFFFVFECGQDGQYNLMVNKDSGACRYFVDGVIFETASRLQRVTVRTDNFREINSLRQALARRPKSKSLIEELVYLLESVFARQIDKFIGY